MRILHVYSGNLYGGVETFFVTLARTRQSFPGIEHHFLLFFSGRLEDELRAAGASIIKLNPVRLRQPLSVVRARRSLGDLLAPVGAFDTVICHSSWSQALFGSIVKRSGLPHVFYLHGPIVKMEWPDRWAARILPDLMIAVSRDTLNSGRKLYPAVAAEVLNYPLPWNIAAQSQSDATGLRAELGAGPSTVVISQLSRLDRWKGQDLLLRALKLMLDDPNWICWIAGGAQRPKEAVYFAELQKLAGALGLQSRVRFIGERRDIPRILAATDIYCQANRGPEGFSLAFMEAFAAGLPIVTTDIGGAGELIDESSGILTPPDDADAIAAGLRRLVVDGDLRRRMGEAAKGRVAERCSPQKQIGRLSELLGKVIGRHKPTPSARR